jgi:hypothetical protein
MVASQFDWTTALMVLGLSACVYFEDEPAAEYRQTA